MLSLLLHFVTTIVALKRLRLTVSRQPKLRSNQ